MENVTHSGTHEVSRTFFFFFTTWITSTNWSFENRKNVGVLYIAIMECPENVEEWWPGYEMQKKGRWNIKQQEKLNKSSTSAIKMENARTTTEMCAIQRKKPLKQRHDPNE